MVVELAQLYGEPIKKFLLTLAAVSVPALGQATEWKTYRDDIVGYSVIYPAFLHLIPPTFVMPKQTKILHGLGEQKVFSPLTEKSNFILKRIPSKNPKAWSNVLKKGH